MKKIIVQPTQKRKLTDNLRILKRQRPHYWMPVTDSPKQNIKKIYKFMFYS